MSPRWQLAPLASWERPSAWYLPAAVIVRALVQCVLISPLHSMSGCALVHLCWPCLIVACRPQRTPTGGPLWAVATACIAGIHVQESPCQGPVLGCCAAATLHDSVVRGCTCSYVRSIFEPPRGTRGSTSTCTTVAVGRVFVTGVGTRCINPIRILVTTQMSNRPGHTVCISPHGTVADTREGRTCLPAF